MAIAARFARPASTSLSPSSNAAGWEDHARTAPITSPLASMGAPSAARIPSFSAMSRMCGDIDPADRKSSRRNDEPVSKTIPATPSPRRASNLAAAMLRLPAQAIILSRSSSADMIPTMSALRTSTAALLIDSSVASKSRLPTISVATSCNACNRSCVLACRAAPPAPPATVADMRARPRPSATGFPKPGSSRLRLGGAEGQRLPQRLHGPPRASGEFEMEAGIAVGEIVPGYLPNAPKPVFKRAAVDNQGLGGLLVAATALQVDRDRFDVIRTAARVMRDQRVQPTGGQLPQIRGIRDLAEQPEHAEIIEAQAAGRLTGLTLQAQSELRLAVGTGEVTRQLAAPADADAAGGFAKFPADHRVQLLPLDVGVGQQDDGVSSRHHQRAGIAIARRQAYGPEQALPVDMVHRGDDDH